MSNVKNFNSYLGLQLLSKEVMDSLSILKRMKSDLDALRNRILKRTKEKLQIVQLTVEVTFEFIL